MPSSTTSSGAPAGSSPVARWVPRPRRWSQQPHHRRRRALALGALALLLILVGIVAGGGLSAPHSAVAHARPGSFFRVIRTLSGTGAGSLKAHEVAVQNAAIDRTLQYTPYVRIAGDQHREVALTFDDGPGPYTPRILSVLEREGVPATFFEVGEMERYFSASTRQIVALDLPIGDHTFSHPSMNTLSLAQQRSQLLNQAQAIARYGAPFPRLFRPPYGRWNARTLTLLHHYKMLMVLWTVDTDDYRRPGVRPIVHSAVSGARPGAIILLHDAGGDRSETVAALPKIIRELRRRGYRLVTVPQLLVDNPPPQNQEISSLGSGG